MLAQGVLDLGIDTDIWPWIWLGVAVVFAIIELTVLAGSFVLLPFAVSAFLSSLLGFYGAPIELQWIVFVLGGGVLFFFAYRLSRRFADDNLMPPGVGADRLVGLTGIVTRPILPDDTHRGGRVTIDGEEWGALTQLDQAIAEGSRVHITAMQGTRVVVEPVSSPTATEGDAT